MILQFTAYKSDLTTALSHAVRAVSSRSVSEILKGLLIEGKGDSLTITGNNMELGIVIVIPAEVKIEGATVLDAKMLYDIVRRVPGNEVSMSVNEQHMANIKSDSSTFDLCALPTKDYPVLPKVKGLKSITLPQAELKRMISKTLFSASDDETKHIHTGILFDAEPNKLTLVALNGHRLAKCNTEKYSDDELSAVLPASGLRELEKMLENNEEATATIHLGKKHAMTELGSRTVVTRVMEGEFFKYKDGIPANGSFTATLEIKPLIQALERVALLITERIKTPVRLAFSEGKLSVSCQTSVGRAKSDIPCECDTEMEAGFNHRYLLDALKHMGGELFRFETSGPLAPFLLLPEENDTTLFMVLPVRLTTNA
jgi:DNA polymerase-3 subunit beta